MRNDTVAPSAFPPSLCGPWLPSEGEPKQPALLPISLLPWPAVRKAAGLDVERSCLCRSQSWRMRKSAPKMNGAEWESGPTK